VPLFQQNSVHFSATCPANRSLYTIKFLTYLTASWPLSFAATSTSAAERRARVLPMNQSSDGLQSSERRSLHFTDHRRCWKCCPSTRTHSSHRRKRFWFTLWRNFVALLALEFETPVYWARRCSDFLGVCSSLAPISSNFSSVSTRRLCFCFLSIKSPVDLSLFTKLWIVCLLRTLSPRNLRRNFRRRFLADPHFT
jgi:hypothetical protein